MKLHTLAAKPQLTVFTLDDEDTVKEFGESIEFYSWDRQPLETFMKLANAQSGDPTEMIKIVKTMILDEDGKEIIKDDMMLPSNLLIKAIGVLVEKLGK
jgi:hypothetical protein